MSGILIVAAGAGRARFFKYMPASSAEARAAPELEEVEDLVRPHRTAPGTHSRPGMARGPGPQAQAYDEHANQHKAAEDEAFARLVVEMTKRLAANFGSRRLVLVAGPKFEGVLRPHHDELRAAGLEIDELPKDLTRLSRRAILAHLDAARLVPQPDLPPGEAARILRTGKGEAQERS